MRILFVGDVVGPAGLAVLAEHLPGLKDRERIDCCIVNAENAAQGFGLTQPVATEIFAHGADILTGGNHLWDKKESWGYLRGETRLARPANAGGARAGPESVVLPLGNGVSIGVFNLLGRVFMKPADCPFRCADRMVEALARQTPIIIVDMHAEATSEKIALGWYLDGRVSAVVGTHTHVQTADERVLPGGTAYISDVGMTGPFDSVIGVEREQALKRFLEGRPQAMPTASGDPCVSAVVLDVDEATGRARSIARVFTRDQVG